MFDTAVMRCSHQCSAPCPDGAEALHAGERRAHGTRVSALLSAIVRSPLAQRGRRRPRSASVSATEPTRVKRAMAMRCSRLHAVAEIPDEMAHAAEHVVHQRPRCSRTGSGGRWASRRTTARASKADGPEASATSQIGEERDADIERRRR